MDVLLRALEAGVFAGAGTLVFFVVEKIVKKIFGKSIGSNTYYLIGTIFGYATYKFIIKFII